MVLFKIENRWPTGRVGSYIIAFKFGSEARPNPATPWCAPFRIMNVPSGSAAIQGMTRWLGIRSSVHVGLGASGAILTQLSSAIPPPMVDPPHIKTTSGSLYGGY